ncbi:DUF4476 domain-containing protein [Lacibacter sediminis]|uniref:DUF4476 domain-containing protein n=1 Tax=Lacibacter sediminis TaxID=2760713 RepID=A0A7G5XIN3_9BACT|nr:DUF4476 domain-containing protein [Lacibacter sediminis]QNA45336.1 hypothetical protein H4075_03795 [Lacibacter sediminis]
MRTSVIRRLALVMVVSAFFSVQAKSQLNHFIYLQTDNQQPFYIKYNNRIISSSSSGYLILPKLKDGVVDFAVGFPKSDQQEQQFRYTIDKADKGFLLKNFSDKGWGLYDLQTSSIVYTAVKTAETNNNPGSTVAPANDPFSNMLSKVTQDSTVKTVTVVKETKPVVVDTPKPAKVEVVVTAPVKDTITVKPEIKPEKPIEQPVVTEPEWTAPSKSPIKQVRKFESREGADFVFEVGEANGLKDTVRLFIERDTVINPVVSPAVIDTPKAEVVLKDTVAVVQQPKKEEPVVKNEEVVEKKEPVTPPVVSEPVQKKETASLPNSNCKDFATEDDLIKLRRRMASQRKDEQMVDEAKKAFRAKCFTTSQLKNLSALFLSDEGRYRFFDAALPFVTDYSNFKSLGETINDDYYKRRFIALLPNQ